MDKAIKVIKASVDALMTLILIIGIIFIFLFIIGIKPYIVLSGSMEPTIKKGSLSFINTHKHYSEVENGDIIAYISPNGEKVTHRVIRITEEGFETKGDKNNVSDGFLTNKETYIGKNIFSIPGVGYAMQIIQTPRGRIVLIVTIMVILTAGFLLDDKKVKKTKE